MDVLWEAIRTLFVISVFCSLARLLTKEGKISPLLRVMVGMIMILTLLSPIKMLTEKLQPSPSEPNDSEGEGVVMQNAANAVVTSYVRHLEKMLVNRLECMHGVCDAVVSVTVDETDFTAIQILSVRIVCREPPSALCCMQITQDFSKQLECGNIQILEEAQKA